MEGRVKFFNEVRHFGFLIVEEDGKERDVFFHGSDCLCSVDALEKGVKVEFEESENERTEQTKAIKVKLVEGD